MLNVREFHYPSSVKQALDLLQKYDGKGMVVGGGTTLSTWKDPKVVALVDLRDLGLSFIKKDGSSLRIGATTAVGDIAASSLVKGFAGGLLARGAASVRSHLLRNA